ncbi:TonB-like protein [Roseobacter sp. SK209-2-6]|uniref:energy transducer TonB n=1 Tax=Roseobacter sp. SK209-2-6 TaxID=388739 RepID=UPI0000F3C7D3|nr:TonB family protein [Roseobacter sp. SK209-2-6]EBA18165.1 TonB-like protein [Roseobacter sp. SK209-2-6]
MNNLSGQVLAVAPNVVGAPIVPGSVLAAVGAFLLALLLHAGLAPFKQELAVENSGGETELAARGSSFANLAEGEMSPFPTQETVRPKVHQTALPVAPETANTTLIAPSKALLVRAEESSKQENLELVPGGVPLLPVSAEESVVEGAGEVAILPVSQKVQQEPVLERSATIAAEDRVSEQVSVQQELQQPVPDPAAQAPKVEQSLRPPTRPEPQPTRPQQAEQALAVQQPRPNPKPELLPKPVTKPRGNSVVNTNRGVTESNRQAQGGQSQRQNGQARVQGNAAVSNYPGKVMRKIQRAKRPASVKGVAVVSFSIGPGGSLAGVGIARSSGSGKLDSIALAQVRRAAPFPPPPAGARTRFTVRIKGN